MIDHKIDPLVWTQDHDVGGGLVVFGHSPGGSVLGKSLVERAENAMRANEDVVFGRLHGRNIVVVRKSSTPVDQAEKIAVAAHEVFHVAVQFSTLRPRLDVAAFPGYPEGDGIDIVNYLAEKLVNAIGSNDDDEVCSNLGEIARSSDDVREYFLYRSYWEWPAEHYMRYAVLDEMDWPSYLDFRRRIGGGRGNPLYELGVLAMSRVDSEIGRNEWQSRYMKGESPINFLSEVFSCSSIVPVNGVQVRISLDEIFED